MMSYMKQSPLKRKTPLKRSNKPLSRGTPMKRSRLRVRGVSDTSVIKEQIQAELRRIVIERDGGCFLRFYPEAGACGSRPTKDGHLILQAEHLHTRANSASYADVRLVVCICERHHIFWKPQHSALYNELAADFIGKERAALWERVREDRRPHPMSTADWKLELVALKAM